MGEVKWIKVYTDIFDNRKIKQIESMPDGDSIMVIWLKLLCLAANVNDNGSIYLTHEIPYTEQMLATQFNRPLSTVQLALNVFRQFGMVDVEDNILMVSNWDKYQNVEGMEKIREQNRIRKQNQRERERIALIVSRDNHVTVTQSHALDIDKDIDKEIDINKRRFTPPSVDEVADYCKERNNGIDAQTFVDFYTSNGWMRGKTKIKDWKACVRTWERNRKSNPMSQKADAKQGIRRNADLDAWLNNMVTKEIK